MISPDLPIMKSSEDKLNRESFAKSLANVIIAISFSNFLYCGSVWCVGKRKDFIYIKKSLIHFLRIRLFQCPQITGISG